MARVLQSFGFVGSNAPASFPCTFPATTPVSVSILEGSPAALSAQAVRLDGTNDHYEIAAPGPAGVADGIGFTWSRWIKMEGGDGALQSLLWIGTGAAYGLKIERLADNKIQAQWRTAAGVVIGTVVSTSTVTVASGWTHVMLDISGTTAVLRVNFTQENNNTAGTAGDIDLTNKWVVGRSDDSSNRHYFNGCMSEEWAVDESLGLGADDKAEQFYDSTLSAPRLLGTNGDGPSADVLVYLNNPYTSFTTNDAGTDFTLTGAVDDCDGPGNYSAQHVPAGGPTAVTRFVNTGSTAGGDGTTNATVGVNRAYATLQEWATAEAKNLVAADETHTVLCAGTAEDTECDIGSWTTSETHFLSIEANGADAAGLYQGGLTWSTSHYRINSVTAATPTITISSIGDDGFLIFSGVQIRNNISTDGLGVIEGSDIGNNSRIVFEYVRSGLSTSSNRGQFFDLTPVSDTIVIEMHYCAIQGERVGLFAVANITLYLFNCGSCDHQFTAISEGSGATHAYNCYAFDNATDFNATTDTVDYCSSDDGFGGDSNHVDSSPEVTEQDGWSAAFTLATGNPFDLRLKDEGGSTNRLLNVGSNTNYPAESGLKFVQRTTDLEGNTVTLSKPSIGPFEDLAP